MLTLENWYASGSLNEWWEAFLASPQNSLAELLQEQCMRPVGHMPLSSLKNSVLLIYSYLMQTLWYFLQGINSYFMHVSEEK